MKIRQRVHVAKAMAAAALAFLGGCNPVSGPADALFQYVGADGKWDNAGQITRKFGSPHSVPRYLIIRDRVYLLTQVTQNHLLNVAVVEQPKWRTAQLTSLIQKHPELKRYETRLRWAGVR